MEGVEPPGGANRGYALVYYRAAATNGRLAAKINSALLVAQGEDPEITDQGTRCLYSYRQLAEVVHSSHPVTHLLFAHARRAYDLGDVIGAQLRFAMLSDAGHLYGHLNAAYLWDQVDSKPSSLPSVRGRCWVEDSKSSHSE